VLGLERGDGRRLSNENSHAEETEAWRRRGELDLYFSFHLRGPLLNPDQLTRETGLVPSRTFQRGEQRRPARQDEAGWYYQTGRSIGDGDMLQDYFLERLKPQAAIFRHEVEVGAAATVTLVGTMLGYLVGSRREADELNFMNTGEFEPFLEGATLTMQLNRPFIDFLGAVGATFSTYVRTRLSNTLHPS
jgi:hypothetical protein